MKISDTLRTLIWLSIFSIAMAYLESAVVVYLRALMYPMGFNFPIAHMQPIIALTEILREAATLIMLMGAGYIGGRYFTQRFAWFIYCFALWDIFYYVFLKLLVQWPVSLFTWDILFLIPAVWTGPVISPVVVALSMIALSMIIVFQERDNEKIYMNLMEWILLIAGSVVLIISFTWDFSIYMLSHYTVGEMIHLPEKKLLIELAYQYVPVQFPWAIFTLGEGIILVAIGMLFHRLKNKTPQP
jgi:hypothetical protein